MSEQAVLSGKMAQRGRWKRFALLFVPVLIACAALFVLITQGALATSFSLSGKPFVGTASSVVGTGFVNYNETLPSKNGTENTVAVNVIRHASAIKDFCIAIPVGPVTTMMKAGGGSTPVSGSNVAFIVQNFTGNAVMHNLVMGQDASTLSAAPGYTGSAGEFGMQASGGITLSNAAMHARELAAGTITLPNFGIAISHGGSCPQ